MGAFDDVASKAQTRAESETLKEVERHERTKLALDRSEEDLKDCQRKLNEALAQLRGEKAACARAEEACDTETKARLQAEARCTTLTGEIKRANGVTQPGIKRVRLGEVTRDRNGYIEDATFSVER